MAPAWAVAALALALAHVAHAARHEPLVDVCCCPKSEVDAAVHGVLARLNRLVRRPYFRYYKTNLEKECPYWAVELMCGMSADGGPAPCHVCTCDEHEVPIALRTQEVCSDLAQSRQDFAQENEVPIDVDRTLPSVVHSWYAATPPWFSDDDQDPRAMYFDLVRNPEANTGYVGEGARRVWAAIYKENCFAGDPQALCGPERAFYRLLSGLHVSISTHVAAFFYLKGADPLEGLDETEQWDPNVQLFMRTVGGWPDRIDNLYFLYMFVLRAVSKAKPFLAELTYITGDVEVDTITRQEIQDLLQTPLLCTTTFNETLMFRGIQNKETILGQMRSHFFNISRLMDCLSCEKCRLWGKLETHGLGTALRVVIEDTPAVRLDRPEVVALVNLLRQLTVAVDAVQRLLRLWHARANDPDPAPAAFG